MKKILIIGYSSLVRRRIIPSLIENKIPYEIASRSKVKKDINSQKWYHGYDNGLKNSNANIVYISLPNSHHFYWATKSLNRGFHTLVDKPSVLNFLQLDKLLNTAKKNKKIISECIFFNYHNQISHVLKKLEKNKPLRINANFSIPKPQKKNILLSKKLNGGVIYDMGPYIAATTRLFFKSIPEKMIKVIDYEKKLSQKIEILFIFKEKSYFLGKFSHNDNYKNFIEIYTKNEIIKLSRVFSPPANKSINLLIKTNKKKNIIKFSDDIFKKYIFKIFEKIDKNQYNYFHDEMIFNMKVREFLQTN